MYSPGRLLTEEPRGLRAVDDDLKKFIAEAHDYTVDNSYFEDNAPTATISFSLLFRSYVWQSIDEDYFGCNYIPINFSVSGPDYRVFHSAAVDLAFTVADVKNGIGTVEDIVFILCEVIGVVIGGMDFSGILAEDDEFEDPEDQRGYEAYLVMARLHATLAEDLNPPVAARQQDIVYVTGHIAYGRSMHTAVEYTTPGSSTVVPHKQWLSAASVKVFNAGKLVSNPKRGTDDENITLSIATSSSYPLPSTHWAALLQADLNYCDDANYHGDADPGAPATEGYNSNGYTRGLLNAANSTAPGVDWDSMWGGDRPLPVSHFQPHPPCNQ